MPASLFAGTESYTCCVATRLNTLGLDNGGDSGCTYLACRLVQQLPGPFTAVVSIGFPPSADSLDFVPELLFLFIVLIDEIAESV